MSEKPDSTGPNPATLRFLAQNLKRLAKGVAKRHLYGGGSAPKPRQSCDICGRLFDFVIRPIGDDTELKPGRCEVCTKALADGFTAIVNENKVAFVKSERLKDMAGQVMRVNAMTMLALKKHFDQEWKKDDTDGQNSGKPVAG